MTFAKGIVKTRTSTASIFATESKAATPGNRGTTTWGVSLSKPARLTSNKTGHLEPKSSLMFALFSFGYSRRSTATFRMRLIAEEKVNRTYETTSEGVDKRQVPADLRG